MSDFHRETTRTARVEHACEEARPRGCRRTARILPGTRYVLHSGAFDGHGYSVKLCLRCDRAWKRLFVRFDPDEDEGPAWGDLVGWLRDAHAGHHETAKERDAQAAERDERYRSHERASRLRVSMRVDAREAEAMVRSGP